MNRGAAIIPYGSGIGDMVNMRPLAESIAAGMGNQPASMIVPEHLTWLLPSAVAPIANAPGLALWQRPEPDAAVSRATRHMKVGQLAGLVRAVPVDALARGLEISLRYLGYGPIVNLLAEFARLDLDARWTAGPWSRDRRHIIDLLGGALREQGWTVHASALRPTLHLTPAPLNPGPVILVNPASGSRLKEPPAAFWKEVLRGLRNVDGQIYLLRASGRRDVIDLAQSLRLPILASRSLRQVACWIAGAQVLISPDTGLLHIAGALRTPVVGLFGSTDPLFTGPYRPEGELLETSWRHERVCRSCWTAQMLPEVRCPVYEPESCMSGISPRHVVLAASRVLAREWIEDHRATGFRRARRPEQVETPPHTEARSAGRQA